MHCSCQPKKKKQKKFTNFHSYLAHCNCKIDTDSERKKNSIKTIKYTTSAKQEQPTNQSNHTVSNK